MGLLGRIAHIMGARRKPRVVIIGLDGVPYSLLTRLFDAGVMPNFAALAGEGTFVRMDAPLPEVSSVSWTSFVTGKNPGETGIFGFSDLQPGTYRLYFPNSSHRRCQALWEVAGEHGRRCVILNIPSTYPATSLAGVMVAGFVAIDLEKAAYPPAIVPTLKRMGYRIDVDTQKGKDNTGALMEDLRHTLEKRIQAIDYFWHQDRWDLFVAVITETDRMHHFLWEALEDPEHAYHRDCIDVYRRIDGFLGEIVDRCRSAREPHTLMAMSDHGFTGIRSEVYLNRWLTEQGYLSCNGTGASLEEISSASRAFALDPSRVYIHLKEKYPRGAVGPTEYEKIREELAARLAALSFQGQPVMKKVFRKEEVYAGPHVDRAPDLVLLSHYGFDLKGAWGKPAMFGQSHFTGCHTQDDAFLYTDGKREFRQKPRVEDVAPLALHELGLCGKKGEAL